MTITIQESSTTTDISTTHLSDHEWRVYDSHIPSCNAESVLGYIEKIGNFYEVLKMDSPRTFLYFTDFTHAIESFAK